MNNAARLARDFRHGETADPFAPILGVVLLDESPGFTGVYYRTTKGLLPARTVDRSDKEHHRNVTAAWMRYPGENEDRTT